MQKISYINFVIFLTQIHCSCCCYLLKKSRNIQGKMYIKSRNFSLKWWNFSLDFCIYVYRSPFQIYHYTMPSIHSKIIHGQIVSFTYIYSLFFLYFVALPVRKQINSSKIPVLPYNLVCQTGFSATQYLLVVLTSKEFKDQIKSLETKHS